jgi:hypothetical protein
MTHTSTAPKPRGHQTRRRGRWQLAESTVVDAVAIDTAARGLRPVALTPTEQRLAAASILAAGGNTVTISARLRVSPATARVLVEQIRIACQP